MNAMPYVMLSNMHYESRKWGLNVNVLIYWDNANKLIIVCDADTEIGIYFSLSLFFAFASCLSYQLLHSVTSGILRHNTINSMWVVVVDYQAIH